MPLPITFAYLANNISWDLSNTQRQVAELIKMRNSRSSGKVLN